MSQIRALRIASVTAITPLAVRSGWHDFGNQYEKGAPSGQDDAPFGSGWNS
jgi:hypothetical protein